MDDIERQARGIAFEEYAKAQGLGFPEILEAKFDFNNGWEFGVMWVQFREENKVKK